MTDTDIYGVIPEGLWSQPAIDASAIEKHASKLSFGPQDYSLVALKRLAEARLAPALEVNIGFSDADGE